MTTLRTWLAWVPAAVWASFIFGLSSHSVLPNPAGADDKLAHAIVYGVLACLCLVGLTGARADRIGSRTAGMACLLAVVYGMTDEFHQSFVPGRTPEVADLLADAAGAVLAVGAAWASAILLRRRASVSPPQARHPS